MVEIRTVVNNGLESIVGRLITNYVTPICSPQISHIHTNPTLLIGARNVGSDGFKSTNS